MSRSMLSVGLLFAASAISPPAFAGANDTASRTTPSVFSSLLGVEFGKMAPLMAQSRQIRTAANGTVTIATRTLDLETLKAADFGDEPSPAAH